MSEDLISRQAAIDAVEEYFGDLPIVVHYDMLQLIKKLPSAERREVQSSGCKYWDDESNFCALHRPSAERRGRWIYKSELYSYCGHLFYPKICSVCNGVFEYTTNYCPNCGARMEE